MHTTSRVGSVSAATLLLACLAAGLLTGCAPAPRIAIGGFPVEATRTATLPPDFPRVRVPLIPGTVIAGDGDAAHGWTVAIAPARGQGVSEATHSLAAAGYLTRSWRLEPATFNGPGYDVRLTDAGGTIVYAVRPR